MILNQCRKIKSIELGVTLFYMCLQLMCFEKIRDTICILYFYMEVFSIFQTKTYLPVWVVRLEMEQ